MEKELSEALRHYQSGNLQEAEKAARQCFAVIEPAYVNATHLLGLIAHRKGQLARAKELISKAISANDRFYRFHLNLGNVFKDEGHFKEAQSCYRLATELAPESSDAHIALGTVQQLLGKMKGAHSSFKKALEFDPESLIAYLNLSILHQCQSKYDKALEYCQETIKRRPNEARFHFQKGSILQELGDVDEAIKAYRHTLTIEPRFSIASSNLKIILSSQDPTDGNIERLKKNAGEKTGDVQLLFELGRGLFEKGEPGQALDALKSVLTIDPEHAAAHYFLGLACESSCKLSVARKHFRHAQNLDPHEVSIEAAIVSVDARIAGEKKQRRRKNRKRVGLHFAQGYHYHLLKPIFEALGASQDRLLSPRVRTLVDFQPDIVVVAESQAPMFRARMPNAKFVWIRHGLISKNTTLHAARVSDFACLPSEASCEWYAKHGGRPRKDFWATGFVQMDPLFRKKKLPLPFTIPSSHKIVLYAPTWNPELSSVPMFKDQLVDLVRAASDDDMTIIIKPHPSTPAILQQMVNVWRQLAKTEPHVHVIEDRSTDIAPYLKASDVLISDASSVVFQYLALNRPIILVNNPARFQSPNFDPRGIEWCWRDVGIEIDTIDDLPDALTRALAEPNAQAERRAHYRQELFGDLTDGRAADRIAKNIIELSL